MRAVRWVSRPARNTRTPASAIAGCSQLNVRMTQNAGVNSYTASGLKIGDVVNYSFTYWDTAHNYAVDTAQQSYTMK